MFCHAQFGREPANDISALLFGICPLFSGSQGYLVVWPKNLDSLRVLVPHAVVQSVCSFGARFQENRDKKKNNQDVHPLFFPFVQQAPFLPFSQILYPDSQDVGARSHHRCELHSDKKFFIARFLSNSNSVLQQGGISGGLEVKKRGENK